MARRSLTGDADATVGAVSRVRFAPSSNNLLVSSWDSGLRLYDADAGTLRFTAASKAALLDCCFEDESTALACGSDGSVRRYDFGSGAQDTVGLHKDAIACIEFSQMSGQVVTGSLDKKLQFWDTKTGSTNSTGTVTLESHVSSLSICGMYLLAAVARNVYFYDIRNLAGPVKAKDCPVVHHVQCLQASAEWNGYVAGSVDGIVALKYFNRGTDGDMGYAFRCHPNSRDGKLDRVSVNCVAIHPWYVLVLEIADFFRCGAKFVCFWSAARKHLLLEMIKDILFPGMLNPKRSCLSFQAIREVWHLWHITIVANFWLLVQAIIMKRIKWWRSTRYSSKRWRTTKGRLGWAKNLLAETGASFPFVVHRI